MFKMSNTAIAINAIGGGAFLIVGVYAAKALMTTEVTSACTSRYPIATQFALRSETGAPLSPIELQASLGRDEWGVIENVEVVPSKGAPSAEVLQVKLSKTSGTAAQKETTKAGTGFVWSPVGMGGPDAACLSYSLMLPKDFTFGELGSLPGLWGGDRTAVKGSTDAKPGFAAHPRWKDDGAGEIHVRAPAAETGDPRGPIKVNFKFPRGKWIKIEQEVVLNAPRKKNGIMRLWVDGELLLERDKVVWRADDKLKIDGVAADVTYGEFDIAKAIKKTEAVRMTPFEMRWR